MRKNALTNLIILMMLASPQTITAAQSFQNDDEKWAKPSVERIALKQRIGEFRFSAPITRGELTDWIVKIWNLKESKPFVDPPFIDVNKENPYYQSIHIARQNQLMIGNDLDYFSPHEHLSREELAVVAARLSRHLGKLAVGRTPQVKRFEDDMEISSWAKEDIYRLVERKIISGFPDGRFYPNQSSTKAEVAVLLDRIVQQEAYKDVPKAKAITVDGKVYKYKKQMTMRSTAYGPFVGSRTATGKRVRFGMIAVDPKVIPLGTKVYVTGYQSPYLPSEGFLAVAEDTGGLIKGNKIDIFINQSRKNLLKFGIQKVKVYILK